MDCIKLDRCPFYTDTMPMDQGIGSIFKKKYCRGNQEQCARYLVYKSGGEGSVPDYLYPNMLDVAHELIDNQK